MKQSQSLILLISVLLITLLFVAGPVRDVQAGGEGTVRVLKEETGGASAVSTFSEEKSDFKKKAKEKIAQMDKKINRLEIKAREAGSQVKAEARKGLRELKEKRAALKKDMKKQVIIFKSSFILLMLFIMRRIYFCARSML
ncbi:MAG: hypothetical protein P8013_14955, partial [Candidatus Sulfobium sp.]